MHEKIPQSENQSLFDSFAEQQVTIKGVSGRLSDLIALCPVREDETDPLKKDEWTLNILTESGVAVRDDQIPSELVELINAKKK